MDYNLEIESIKQFLLECTQVDDEGKVSSKYEPILTKLANGDDTNMYIELSDLKKFNNTLATNVSKNTLRYTNLFYQALDSLLPSSRTSEPDILDIFLERSSVPHRTLQTDQDITGPSYIDGKYSPDLIRKFEIHFKPIKLEPKAFRQVSAESVGNFVTVRGIVTRASEIKAKLTIATYFCDQCDCESFQPIRGPAYTPLFVCKSARCIASKTIGNLTFQARGSKFVKFQEIKLQEHSNQLPIGQIPRTMTVNAHGELTRRCITGDQISVSGIFLPVVKSNYRFISETSTTDTFIEAHYITKMNRSEIDELNVEPLTDEELDQLNARGEDFLAKLSRSIAPEIFGHDELKKALLLLLVGGVDKNAFGVKIRGSINICLMGDPGVAKSQLLCFINRLGLKSQYTTGRGSSGVGLTAAVVKDPITSELILEGGALVLADEGICCIDEFDKMMDADRTAIHEVMEQQTVSIAKAGIITSLNSRVSILAAANPVDGRYNMSKSIAENLQIPPALLSRFDLLWLIRDTPERAKDLDLAEHVMSVHKDPNSELSQNQDYMDMTMLRRYISLCKLKNPFLPEKLGPRIREIYLNIRERKRINPECDSLFTSPRSLLAIIRMSTAFARLRLAENVEEEDIRSAVDLYTGSRKSIEREIDENIAPQWTIIKPIRDILSKEESKTLSMTRLKEIMNIIYSIPAARVAETIKVMTESLTVKYDEVTDKITLDI